MSATVVCDFFQISFGKPFFFPFSFVLLCLRVVYKKEMDQKNAKGTLFFNKIFICCVDLEHTLLLCFSKRLAWSAVPPS